MAYNELVSRAKPGLIVMIIDDSGSMNEDLPGTKTPKYEWTERLSGIVLNDLLTRSSEVRGNNIEVKPRYYLTVIKYGCEAELWGSPEMDIKTAVELFTNSDNSFELDGRLGGTDAKDAFELAYKHLQQSLASGRFDNSFPPMVFHLTDGESFTDASSAASRIKQLKTNDGNALIVNAYVGTKTDLAYQGPDDFPGYTNLSRVGASEDNVRLYEMSSDMPESIESYLKENGIFPSLDSRSRMFFDVRTKEMFKETIQVIGSIGNSRMAR